jgi:hypothetical protein
VLQPTLSMPLNIHTIYQGQPAAKLLFDWILRVGVEDGRTTVEELMEYLEVPRKAAIHLLRSVAEAGHGEFKVGRKGHPSRLEWSDDPHTLAARLRGDEHAAASDPSGPRPNGRDPELDPEPDAPVPGLDTTSSGSGPRPQLGAGVRNTPTPRRRASTRAAKLIEHSYVLRPQLRVVIALPEDLSAPEAEVLASWIRNLSFER